MANNLITKYIAAWNWQILAIMFLIASFLAFSMPLTYIGRVMSIAFLFTFFICEAVAIKRKKEVFNSEQ